MRKPEDRKTAAERREVMWQYIRFHEEFCLRDLTGICELDPSTILLYLRNLVKAGIIEIAGYLPHPDWTRPERWWRLVKDSIEPPRVRNDGSEVTQGIGRERMWNLMRAKTYFVLRDLSVLTSDEKHRVSRGEALRYLRWLETIGYVINLDGAPRTRATYRLINDTGPLAIVIQRGGKVWDPNLKEVVWTRTTDK